MGLILDDLADSGLTFVEVDKMFAGRHPQIQQNEIGKLMEEKLCAKLMPDFMSSRSKDRRGFISHLKIAIKFYGTQSPFILMVFAGDFRYVRHRFPGTPKQKAAEKWFSSKAVVPMEGTQPH